MKDIVKEDVGKILHNEKILELKFRINIKINYIYWLLVIYFLKAKIIKLKKWLLDIFKRIWLILRNS